MADASGQRGFASPRFRQALSHEEGGSVEMSKASTSSASALPLGGHKGADQKRMASGRRKLYMSPEVSVGFAILLVFAFSPGQGSFRLFFFLAVFRPTPTHTHTHTPHPHPHPHPEPPHTHHGQQEDQRQHPHLHSHPLTLHTHTHTRTQVIRTLHADVNSIEAAQKYAIEHASELG